MAPEGPLSDAVLNQYAPGLNSQGTSVHALNTLTCKGRLTQIGTWICWRDVYECLLFLDRYRVLYTLNTTSCVSGIRLKPLSRFLWPSPEISLWLKQALGLVSE
ncbi:hypothetical protein Tco_0417229 [Tanacetum coccineum]